MIEEKITTEHNTLTYHQLGFKAAAKSNSHLSALKGHLETVYNVFLRKQELDEAGLKARVEKLKGEIEQEKAKKNDLSGKITSQTSEMEQKKEKIEQLRLEQIDLKKGDDDDDSGSEALPFVIGAFITLLLTLYLFLFYSSTAFSVFYGVDTLSNSFINADVFSMAGDKGSASLIIIILFPVIFLAVGFVLHAAMEKNKTRRKQNKRPKYFGIFGILLLTFLVDSLIGYKISEGLHNNAFNSGLTKKTWEFNMVLSDINFYLILFMGFIVYVFWGILLNYILGHNYLKSQSERTKLLIENNKKKIQDHEESVRTYFENIQQLGSSLENCSHKIQAKLTDIIGYEGGVIPVDIPSLRAALGDFMGGYQTYAANSRGNSDDTKELIKEAIEIKDSWLEQHIHSLRKAA